MRCIARDRPRGNALMSTVLAVFAIFLCFAARTVWADVEISAAGTGCNLKFSNQITSDDAVKVLESECVKPDLTVSGPGGDVYAAMAIGRWARERDAFTYVPEGAHCYSSCALIYMSGVRRLNSGEIGLHRPYLAGAPKSAAEVRSSVNTMLSDMREYVEEMGVTSAFTDVMTNTPPSKMRTFLKSEIDALVPGDDPLYNELQVAEDASYYGIATDEFRHRELEAQERCVIFDFATKRTATKTPAMLWEECRRAVLWGLSQTVYESRAKAVQERCIAAGRHLARDEVHACRVGIMQGR